MFPIAADNFTANYECALTDPLCHATEKLSTWMGGIVLWLAESTLGGEGFRPGTSLWDTALSQSSIWLGLAVLVMMLTGIVGITAGAVMLRPDFIKRTIVGTLLAFPATIFAYFMVGEGLRVMDDLSTGLLDRLGGQDGFSAFIGTALTGDSSFEKGSKVALAISSGGGGPQMIGQAVIVLVILLLGVLMIAFAMAFRNFVLLLLIAFAPLAFVLLPAQGGGTWVKRWIAAVTAMALAKPLTIGVLGLVMAGFSNAGTIWSATGFASLIGLFIAAFMPIMLYSFFQFIGGDGGGGDQVASRAGQTIQSAPQQAAMMRRGGRGGGAPGAAGAAGAAGSAAGKATASGKAAVQSGAQQAGGVGQKGASRRPGANVGTQPTFSQKPTTPPQAPPPVPSPKR